MQFASIKAIVAMLWVSTVAVVGIAGNLNSSSSWTVLAAVGVIPTLVMMRQWNDPRESMAQSLQEALR